VQDPVRDRGDFAALNDAAAALFNAGRFSEARDLYLEAVRRFPENDAGHANLACTYYELGEFTQAKDAYEAALRLNPRSSVTHSGYAKVCSSLGDESSALRHFQTAMALRPVRVSRYTGEGTPVKVLQLISAIATNANTNTACLFDERVFQTTSLCIEFWDPAKGLPAHEVIFNGLSDADTGRTAMDTCALLLLRSSAPVVNHPRKLRETGRAHAQDRLADIPGVRVPRVARLSREDLIGSGAERLFAHGLRFPLLLRSPGYHNGQHFVLVDAPDGLREAISALPGEDLLAIEFVDTRADDGNFWKYRVMIVDDVLYPLHLAISNSWKVHYYSAQMGENAEHRAKEAEFLRDFRAVLGPIATQALEQIRERLQVDYGGIDFGIAADGRVVVFEANATMAVLDPPSGEEFAYRGAAITCVRDAVKAMLLGCAGAG
jgi:glutathione synthase/RimK-type ligase-like ATP-grasp enzyme